MLSNNLDNCPVCGRKILDFDPEGIEYWRNAQRFCLSHAPSDWQSPRWDEELDEDFDEEDYADLDDEWDNE